MAKSQSETVIEYKNRMLQLGADMLILEAAEWRARDPVKEKMGRDKAQHERIAETIQSAAKAIRAAIEITD